MRWSWDIKIESSNPDEYAPTALEGKTLYANTASFTQVYKWVPVTCLGDLMMGETLRRPNVPFKEEEQFFQALNTSETKDKHWLDWTPFFYQADHFSLQLKSIIHLSIAKFNFLIATTYQSLNKFE